MHKLLFSLLALGTITLCGVILAQGSNSIQINGGVISPMSSSTGLTGSVQFNYSFSEQINFYAYTGYSIWDKYKIKFLDESADYGPKFFNSYSADDHILVPFYIGCRIVFHTNKLFSSFLDIETGYSYLRYYSFDQMKIVDPETGEILGYHPDSGTKEENKENLFGIGIGAGLSHPISSSMNMLLSFKLNSYVNENYHGLFSRRGTYTTFSVGFNYTI